MDLTALKSGGIRFGSQFRLREKIGGRFYLSTIVELTELTEKSFALKGLFPYSLVNLRVRFSLVRLKGDKTKVVAENYAGYDWPVIGKIFDQVLLMFLSYDMLKRHMLEENNGIKREIERMK